jgi:hypothetical protein
MKAYEARKISESFVDSKHIDTLWERLCARIRLQAEKGHHSLVHPWTGICGSRLDYASREEQEALTARLRADGYKVTDHPDPDPGHPCSGAYTEVTW